jgi:hypothetical protein
VGLLLGDLYAHIAGRCVNVKLTFRQGIVHKEYLLHLYDLFSNFCPQGPKIQNSSADIRTGKVYSAIYFLTYSLSCFNDIFKLFYLNKKKVIPANIGQLLTPLSLCYWIADDGSWNKSKGYVVLCTNSFTLEEVNLLIGVLNEKWDLKCYKAKQNSGYVIIIPSYSVSNLQTLLKPYMPSMMYHKIGL